MNARLSESEFYENLVYVIILVLWFIQQAFFGYIGIYLIANVSQVMEKYYERMPLLSYKTKAKFNLESFQIMDMFVKQRNFKVICFAVDKNLRERQSN